MVFLSFMIFHNPKTTTNSFDVISVIAFTKSLTSGNFAFPMHLIIISIACFPYNVSKRACLNTCERQRAGWCNRRMWNGLQSTSGVWRKMGHKKDKSTEREVEKGGKTNDLSMVSRGLGR